MKTQMVLDLLRGKPIEEVSRENQVTVADLSEWRTTFLTSGEAAFKKQPDDSRYAEYERALGRLQMENELLKKKRDLPNLRPREFIEAMKDQTSEAAKRTYPRWLILLVAGLTSAAYYRKRSPKIVKARPGPKTGITDEQLLLEIRKEISEGLFLDEGCKKTWKRLKRRGIKASKGRVHRVMRDNNLLSITRPKPERKVNEHTGSIKTELPNRMWGTDGKKFYTQQDGWCWFFGVIDHFNDEIMAWHANQSGTRFDAMEPVRMAVKKTYGTIERHVCKDIGLFMRTDHGSQYDSHDFQKELKFLGLVYSPAFVRSPECNGIIERFHRTLDEQVFDLQVFESLEDARKAIGEFIEKYNRSWLIHRLGLVSPLEYREAHEKRRGDAA